MAIEDVKSQILAGVSLETLIGETVELKRRGGRPTGLCPFHEEKSPSFYLYDDHYYCFGCKASGDAIDFVRKHQGLGFVEALRFLGEKYAIDTSDLDSKPKGGRLDDRNTRLYGAIAAAQELFQRNLTLPPGSEALDYLRRRGFSKENIREFGFGWAASGSTTLVDNLRRLGYTEDEVFQASLGSRSDNRQIYDFYRSRITIPIRDDRGRPIGFGGRIIHDIPNAPKYKNSRESKLFDKSRILYGFDRARSTISRAGRGIVTEGYMDVLQLWQCGVSNVVACLGTALTVHHLRLLNKSTSEVILLFDGDSAGAKATLAAVNTALEVPELGLRVAVLPGGADPDSFVRENGTAALDELVNKSTDLFDFAVISKVNATAPSGIPSLIEREFIPWLARIENPVQKASLGTRIAQLTGVSMAQLSAAERSQHQASTSPNGAPAVQQVNAPPKPQRAISRLLFECLGHLYFCDPNAKDRLSMLTQLITELECEERWRQFGSHLARTLESGQAPSSQDIESLTTDTDETALCVKFLSMQGAFQINNIEERLSRLTYERQRERLKETKTALKRQLVQSQGQNSGDSSDLIQVLTAIRQVDRELLEVEAKFRS